MIYFYSISMLASPEMFSVGLQYEQAQLPRRPRGTGRLQLLSWVTIKLLVPNFQLLSIIVKQSRTLAHVCQCSAPFTFTASIP